MLTKSLHLLLVLCLAIAFNGSSVALAQSILSWNASNATGGNSSTVWGASPLPVNTINTNLTLVTGLVRGSGLAASGTPAADCWGGSGGWGTTPSATNSFTFSFKPKTGFTTSLSSVTGFTRRSGSGPSGLTVQYSIDGTNFTTAGTWTTTSTTGTTGTSGSTTLSGITALQNVPATTTIYFRLSPSGTTGNYYITNTASVVVNGTVVASVAPPVINSTLTASATYGTAAPTYTITATNTPTSFGATGLPPGLSINTANGQITGTPTSTVGSPYSVTITANNAGGTSTKTLVYTINKKALQISGLSVTDKEYDQTTVANLTGTAGLTGVFGSDNVTLSAYSIAYQTATAGAGKAMNLVSYTLGGSTGVNYTLTLQAGFTGNILQKQLTITGISANDKIFDGLTTATLSGTATLVGVIDPDAVSLAGTPSASFADPAIGINKPVSVTGYTLSGGDAVNYTLQQPSGLTANISSASWVPPPTPTGSITQAVGCGSTVLTHANATYFWQGTDPSGNISTPGASTANPYTALSPGTYYVRAYNPSNGGCFSTSSQSVVVTVDSAPVITVQPVDQAPCAGTAAGFSVMATGSGLSYQWRKDGVDLPGATTDTYTIASAAVGDVGAYDVIVSGTCPNPDTSTVALLTLGTPPSITTGPSDNEVCLGSSVSFSVVATGANLTYQWKRGASDISGATGSSYTIPSAAAGDAANYSVVVSGSCGSPVTSSTATLVVDAAPAITTQPAAQSGFVGSPVTFSVVASGAGLSYQWYKGASLIAGATAASYTIPSVVAGDAGSYKVVVSGTCPSPVTSNTVTLTIGTPDFINLTAPNTAVGENFDGMGSGTATPTGFSIQDGATSTSLLTNTTQQASSGAPATGGSYNWGQTASERALGLMFSGSYSGRSVVVKVRNSTGAPATAFQVSFDYEQYRRNTASQTFKLQYSTALASGWVDVPSGGFTNIQTGTSTYGFTTLMASQSIVNLTYSPASAVPDGGDVYFRWTLSGTTNSNGVGIDNFSIQTFQTCSTPTVQVSNISIGNITGTTADISWTPGNGGSRVVYINTVNSFSLPANGTTYTANTVWQNASYQAIYVGTGSGPVTVTGLSGNTTYYLRAFEYCATGPTYFWNAATGNGTSFSTGASLPSLTTATVTGITDVAATSGGTISSNGGSTITESGVVFGTSPAPTANPTADGSPSGTYSSNLASLAPQTQHYVRAYAINGVGTGYGNELSFYTLSSSPTAQAVNLIASASSSSQVDLTWEAATFPATGATFKGYVLLRATAPQIPTLMSADGMAPTAGVGVIVSSTITDPTALYSNTGLIGNTTYNYLLVPFTWDGVHTVTCNYFTTGSPTATTTTPPGSCTEPSTQASGVSFSATTSTTTTVSWTVAPGTSSLVVIRSATPVDALPVDGTTYVANSSFGTGDNLGAFQYAVYGGTGNSIALTGLAPSTTYYIGVYSYDPSGFCYKATGPASGNVTTPAAASSIETFEPAVKGSYATGTATGSLGAWTFTDALIGNTAGSDRFNGTRSARIENVGSIQMQFDKDNGIGTITVKHAKYGGDATSTWRLYVSDNGGATFDAYQSSIITSSTTTLATASIPVNLTGSLRIRIAKLGGGQRLNIDDIAFTDFVPSNTVTTGTVAGSPYCITSTTDYPITIPFTSTGIYASENVYVAQLSDASGSFGNAVEIGTLASTASSGTIPAIIPAGTASGTGYKIRVLATSPNVTGSQTAANLTVYLNTPDVSGLNASITSGTALTLGWTNPLACFDQVLVVARSASPVTALPTGDGTAYTANAAFGTGGSGANLPAGEFVLYKGTGNSVNVTGLTALNLYFFKVYLRKGTEWSDGSQISATPADPQDGDFRSVLGSNLPYNQAATWQRFTGGSWVSASTAPAANANITIQSGSTVYLSTSASGTPVNNLTVNAGGKLYANDSAYSGNRYLTVYGNITCNGTIGNGFGRYDNISFNIEGNPSTISGVGSFNGSRMRKNFNVNPTSSLIIAMNVGLKFASGVGGSSGTVMYNATSGTSFNVTLNQNTTLNLFTSAGESGNLSIDGINGEGSGNCGGTFTVNGTLNIPGTLFAFTDNTTAPVAYIIGTSGVVNCVNVCTGNSASSNTAVQNGSAAAGCTLRILDGGKLNMTGGTASNTNTYNKPFSKRSNTTSPYVFAAGLGTSNQVYDFQPGSTVQYSSGSGSMPVQTSGLTYANLLISGGATSTLATDLNVTGDLKILSPAVLDPVGKNINLGGNWSNYGSAGFAEGAVGSVIFNGTAKQTISCVEGEQFYDVRIANASSEGVELNTDVTILDNLDLGTNGRLFFGSSPSVLSLTRMNAASNTLLGSGAALIDMSGAAHMLNIGCSNLSYDGIFVAGTDGLVNYNRDNSLSGTGGTQAVMEGITYAHLSLSGSDAKTIPGTLSVSKNLTIDGASTRLDANTPGTSVSLGGDVILS